MSGNYGPDAAGGRSSVDEPGGAGRALARPKVILGLLITAAAIWFIIANNTRVRIHLWLTWVSARLWLVLLITFVAGVLVGLLFAWRRSRRR